MTTSDFEQKQFELSVMAGMNQRYHQSRATLWSRCDRGAKIAVGIFAVASLCLTAFTMTLADAWLVWTSLGVAIASAIAAIALNVLPLGEWASDHIALFQRWTDLREDVDGLLFELKGQPSGELLRRLKQLDSKAHRICGAEPGCRELLLQKCYAEEYKSRQPAAAS